MRQGRETCQGDGAGDTPVRQTSEGDTSWRQVREEHETGQSGRQVGETNQGDKSGRRSRRQVREKEQETSQGEGAGDKSGRRSRRQVREISQGEAGDKAGR